MSQNNKLLEKLGVPVLTSGEKAKLRTKWQADTWDDMIKSLNQYGKYIMLRPTGFGKTFTSACACNIGVRDLDKEKKLGVQIKEGEILLNDGTIIENNKLANIKNKKVIFVYVSQILKDTFDKYNNPPKGKKALIKRDKQGNDRIQYETYASVALNWGKKEYLLKDLDIKNVGLVIFDEVQRMGALNTTRALDVAIPILKKLGIPYIGATATVERATGYDVCDKYFTHRNPDGSVTYCWGEHIYTLDDTFNSGLLIPPYYQYIEENKDLIEGDRTTRLSMLQELKVEYANSKDVKDKKAIFNSIQELEQAVIKNSSKIIHDSMMTLYNCGEQYITSDEELKKVESGSIERPENLPKYMRFLVFAPDRASLDQTKQISDGKYINGLVGQTENDFKEAFERYGYKIKNTIISSINKEETDNVRHLDRDINGISEEELEKAVIPRDGVIDLVYSINMLNVGYHVEHITGLIFKRWTASNQIYLQQLGRCLSANSDLIPIVFDFVNSVDDRGITAPMFTRLEPSKEITENADGTQNTLYTNAKKKRKSSKIDEDQLVYDAEGNLVDPRKCNVVSAKYVTVGMGEADIKKIVSRANVYLNRKQSREMYENCYKFYTSRVNIVNGHLVSDITEMPCLDESLRLGIRQAYPETHGEIASINSKAYYEYLRDTNKTVYIEYRLLENYYTKNDTSRLASEYNSIIAMNKGGLNVNILMNKEDIAKFKQNKDIQAKLKELGVDSKKLITYTL